MNVFFSETELAMQNKLPLASVFGKGFPFGLTHFQTFCFLL